jgi:hypothetical protein
VESNRQSSSPPTQHRLDDLRLGNYDRMLGERYVEQGEVLADLVIRASHGIRTLLVNPGKMLRAALTHKPDYTKNGVAHSD